MHAPREILQCLRDRDLMGVRGRMAIAGQCDWATGSAFEARLPEGARAAVSGIDGFPSPRWEDCFASTALIFAAMSRDFGASVAARR